MTDRIRWHWFYALAVGAAFSFAACNCGGVSATCQSTKDCGGGLVCLATQTCALACANDGNCAATERCSSAGGCVAKGSCGANADCDAGFACTAGGSCEKACIDATDCGGGVCLQNKTCATTCTNAAQCQSGEKCSTAGGCVPSTGCGSNADCSGGQLCDTLGKCSFDCRTGKCNSGAWCNPDNGMCVATNNPDGGQPSCGGELFQAAKVNSNMLIAFDKSGSMSEIIGDAGLNKWVTATGAINQVVGQYQSQIQFGLMLFPAGNTSTTQCVPAPVSVQVGDQRAAQISSVLSGAGPGGRTPIGGVLTSAGQVPELHDPARANYVMLVTDGSETCNGNGVQAATRNLADAGIKTFVVGFGNGVDATNLAAIATAGGTPRPGTPKYYQADDGAGLLAAFNIIAQGALGCEYKLASAPPDPSKIFVYVNGVFQNRDPSHANGWDYSPATLRITFYGSLCQLVATDASAKVSIVYGCRDDSIVEVDRPDGGAKLPNGSACVVPADCANGQCVGGVCGKPVGSSCTQGADCASQVCTGGVCQPGIG